MRVILVQGWVVPGRFLVSILGGVACVCCLGLFFFLFMFVGSVFWLLLGGAGGVLVGCLVCVTCWLVWWVVGCVFGC